MALLFSKYIDCSVKCLSRLPITISLHPPSFTFRPFLPLSSSSSSPPSPSLNVILDFLTKECGFSSSQVTRAVRIRPTLLRIKSDHIAREIIHTLRDYGFTQNQLKSAIARNPSILTLKVDGELKPRLEFLKQMGLAPQDLPAIISITPEVLTAGLENSLGPRILHLRNLFGSNVRLCQALKTAPHLLMADCERQVKPKMEYVKNFIGISEGSAGFLRALRAVLGYSLITLEKKTKHLASLGLAEDEIRLIIKRSHGAILSYSTKKLKENLAFLIHTAGFELKTLALYPAVFYLSLEKRLKPRYEVYKYLTNNPQSKGLPGLITYFKLSEKEYIKHFGQYSTKSGLTIIQSPKASNLEQ